MNEKNIWNSGKKNAIIKERFSHDDAFDLSKYQRIGIIKKISPNMEFSFEMKVENIVDSYCYNSVLSIDDWFCFAVVKYTMEESKFYINYRHKNGLEQAICGINLDDFPNSFSNNWRKEFF